MLKEDARILKTKNKLVEVFLEMLSENDFEDITVNQLCSAADIRRATFYKHFKDKEDFLRYYVYTKRVVFDRRASVSNIPVSSLDYYLEYPKGIIKFLRENEIITKRALSSEVAHRIIRIVSEQNYEDTKERLESAKSCGMKLSVSPTLLAVMLTGAIANAIIKWFEDGMTLPEEKLLEELCIVIRAMINA